MRIGLITGGISSERQISLKTGEAMLDALEYLNYDVVKVVLDSKDDIKNMPEFDFGLLALHGKLGEDGTIQNYLDLLDIPYSGCNGISSAICMDKNLTKRVINSYGVPTAKWATVKDLDQINNKHVTNLKYPLFVKPNSGGSSVATFKVNNRCELIDAVAEALKWDIEVMIEEFIPGKEITCAMLNGKLLPLICIESENEFFDIESKYSSGLANEYVVTFPKETHERIESICKDVWDSIGCEVYCRIDIILNENEMNVLEVNTLPGFTPSSLYPQAAKAAGYSISELLEIIIKSSLEKREYYKLKREEFAIREKEYGLSSKV